MQLSDFVYMNVDPSIEDTKQTWIKPDDDSLRVEYATLNHQHVPNENQPVHDLSTAGESDSQVKTLISLTLS